MNISIDGWLDIAVGVYGTSYLRNQMYYIYVFIFSVAISDEFSTVVHNNCMTMNFDTMK
jgi:hypothetical protein